MDAQAIYDATESGVMRMVEAIAAGVSKAEASDFLARSAPYRDLGTATRATMLHDALIEAQNQGIEREDIDPSWF